MDFDLDDLLGRIDLIDRRIAREEREQKAREQQEPTNANRRRDKHTSNRCRSQKRQSVHVSPPERRPPRNHQQQLSERPEQERQPTEVSSRRYIQARSEISIHAQVTWEEARIREYSLPREASRSSFTQSPADAQEDPPPPYSEAAQETQQAEPSEASQPSVKKQKQQIRAKKYEGALKFLAGRRRLGTL